MNILASVEFGAKCKRAETHIQNKVKLSPQGVRQNSQVKVILKINGIQMHSRCLTKCPSEKHSENPGDLCTYRCTQDVRQNAQLKNTVKKDGICLLTDALGDVGRGMASIGEGQGEGAINFEAKIRVILVPDEDTEALLALLHHLLQPTAAVNGSRLGIAADIRQARGEADEFV